MQKIRISEEQLSLIKDSFKRSFLKDDKLWIFGSRADLLKKGGDIDIYIETNSKSLNEAVKMKQKFYIDLQIKLGEQKIDIVLNVLNSPTDLKIYDIAKNEGVNIV